MTTTVISGSAPYGAMTNKLIGGLLSGNATMERLHDAIATATAGYTGVAGTQFEVTTNPGGFVANQNLFSVVPSAIPGEQGTAYNYAMGRLHEEWVKFWELAEPFVNQLDNGQGSI